MVYAKHVNIKFTSSLGLIKSPGSPSDSEQKLKYFDLPYYNDSPYNKYKADAVIYVDPNSEQLFLPNLMPKMSNKPIFFAFARIWVHSAGGWKIFIVIEGRAALQRCSAVLKRNSLTIESKETVSAERIDLDLARRLLTQRTVDLAKKKKLNKNSLTLDIHYLMTSNEDLLTTKYYYERARFVFESAKHHRFLYNDLFIVKFTIKNESDKNFYLESVSTIILPTSIGRLFLNETSKTREKIKTYLTGDPLSFFFSNKWHVYEISSGFVEISGLFVEIFVEKALINIISPFERSFFYNVCIQIKNQKSDINSIFYTTKAEKIYLPTIHGELCLYGPEKSPSVVSPISLNCGALCIFTEQKWEFFAVNWGYVEINGLLVNIVADEILWAKNIDREEVKKTLKRIQDQTGLYYYEIPQTEKKLILKQLEREMAFDWATLCFDLTDLAKISPFEPLNTKKSTIGSIIKNFFHP